MESDDSGSEGEEEPSQILYDIVQYREWDQEPEVVFVSLCSALNLDVPWSCSKIRHYNDVLTRSLVRIFEYATKIQNSIMCKIVLVLKLEDIY